MVQTRGDTIAPSNCTIRYNSPILFAAQHDKMKASQDDVNRPQGRMESHRPSRRITVAIACDSRPFVTVSPSKARRFVNSKKNKNPVLLLSVRGFITMVVEKS